VSSIKASCPKPPGTVVGVAVQHKIRFCFAEPRQQGIVRVDVSPLRLPGGRVDEQQRAAKTSSDPLSVDPHASIGRLIEALNEVLDLSQHLLIPHCLGRLAMSIIMARWKYATAPATAFRRWNRLTSPGSGGSSAPVPS
jgi:hypothetical protein